jgi:hypothetical protein
MAPGSGCPDMAMIKYTVMRNLPATNDKGQSCKIAVALVQHENGTCQRVASDEEFIRYAGEGVIEAEVLAAASNPSDGSIVRNLNHYDSTRR